MLTPIRGDNNSIASLSLKVLADNEMRAIAVNIADRGFPTITSDTLIRENPKGWGDGITMFGSAA